MADNRPVRIITKQTAVPGRIPTGTTGNESNFIKQGELAQNTVDRKLFGYDGTNIFEYGSNTFVGLTGGTITGDTGVIGALSAETFISGSTNLYDIFQVVGTDTPHTQVQPGSNITTGGTSVLPIISTVASPSFNSITSSGASSFVTLSATTFISGSTDLYSIFQPQSGVLKQKNGSVSGSTFAGNPKTATVTFATAFTNNNYAVTITGTASRTWSIESKTSSGFTINANANLAFVSDEVFWMAAQIGESN